MEDTEIIYNPNSPRETGLKMKIDSLRAQLARAERTLSEIHSKTNQIWILKIIAEYDGLLASPKKASENK